MSDTAVITVPQIHTVEVEGGGIVTATDTVVEIVTVGGALVGTLTIGSGGTGATTSSGALRNFIQPLSTNNLNFDLSTSYIGYWYSALDVCYAISGNDVANVIATTTRITPVIPRARAVASVTGPLSLNDTHGTILAGASLGGFTVTLPTAVGRAGKSYVIKKTDATANVVTIGTTSSQTIDGTTTKTLTTQYQAIEVQSNGAAWLIIGKV